MSLWAMIGWFFAFAIIVGLVLFAVARMVVDGLFREPSQDEDSDDSGGWPVNASGYPIGLPKTIGQYGAYEDALDRFFARRADV